MDQNTIKSTLNLGDRILNGGITTLDGSRKIAKRLMDLYDIKKLGYLTTLEVNQIMIDLYRCQNKVFYPSI